MLCYKTVLAIVAAARRLLWSVASSGGGRRRRAPAPNRHIHEKGGVAAPWRLVNARGVARAESPHIYE